MEKKIERRPNSLESALGPPPLSQTILPTLLVFLLRVLYYIEKSGGLNTSYLGIVHTVVMVESNHVLVKLSSLSILLRV
jgi:hypothetical protein